MMAFNKEEKNHARIVLGIKNEQGSIPVSERTVEALIDTIALQRERHHDRLTELNGSIEALHKRLRSHRKAKAKANKRADTAVAAMREMLGKFEEVLSDA